MQLLCPQSCVQYHVCIIKLFHLNSNIFHYFHDCSGPIIKIENCKHFASTKNGKPHFIRLPKHFPLFPLNRSNRLRRQIQAYAVDSLYLIGDTICDLVKYWIRNFLNRSTHRILGIDGADNCRPSFVSLSIFHTNTGEIRYGNKVLPYMLSKTADIELFTKNGICFAKCMKTVSGNCSKTSYTKSRSREWLTVNHLFWKAKCITDYTDFFFE